MSFWSRIERRLQDLADDLLPDDFRAALDAAVASGETTLIEVRTDRTENRALHARVADAVLSYVHRD